MAITFAKAPRVYPGDKVRSSQLAQLATAFNDRLRSGLGDPSFRIGYWFLSLFRSLIHSGNTAAFYEEHQARTDDWPVHPRSYPGGVSLSSLLGLHVYGDDTDDGIQAEYKRLALPLAPATATPAGYWQLAKEQRGAWDPATGATGAPAFDAARSYADIRFSSRSPIGKSYGSYLPTPELMPDACEDPDASDDYGPPPNYEIKFKSITGPSVPHSLCGESADKTYPGTCQDGPSLSTPGMYDAHIYTIGYTPWAYYVVLNDGTVEVLPTTDWLEGPYCGPPRLQRPTGGQVERTYNRFAGDFRGSDQAQKAMTTDRPSGWNRKAFDFQRFLRNQYILAPARGTESGDDVVATYPERSCGSMLAGDGLEPFVAATDCTIAALFFQASDLQQDATLEVLIDDEVSQTVRLTPAAPDKILVMEPAGATVTVRDRTAVVASGLRVEAAELMDYKPSMHDLMLVLRLMRP